MLYDITLRIDYEYEFPVDSSRHIVRIMPADLPGEQRLIAASHHFSPVPDEEQTFTDYFGNRAVALGFVRSHKDIGFRMTSRVERLVSENRFDTSSARDRLADDIARQTTVAPSAPHHFLASTERVPIEPETTAFARDHLSGSQSTLESIAAIGGALNQTMRFDAQATTVDTPMIDSFRNRHGVCQDFTHIMIACLRGIGIPAGYVSGYLRTLPPPGGERLEGADAMHAWVRAWCGGDMGWVEYDPTNAIFAGTDHIVVARGRDYHDVAPVKGMMRGYGGHTTRQSVDVTPVTAKAG